MEIVRKALSVIWPVHPPKEPLETAIATLQRKKIAEAMKKNRELTDNLLRELICRNEKEAGRDK